MQIDSHVHVFLADSSDYPWDPHYQLRPTYDAPVEDLLIVMDEADVEKAVIVQHSCYGYDNRYIVDCSQRYPKRFCSIVKVDPLAEDAPHQLAHLAELACVVGLRLQPVAQPQSTWLADKRTFPLWEVCASTSLVIGILLDAHQLVMAEAVIRQFPSVNVIIDHMGRFPGVNSSTKEAFQHLLNLSALENVFVKVSGFYALSQEDYPYLDLSSQVEELYQAFGASRLMWASDYPLVIHAGETYAQATDILSHQLPKLTVDEQGWMMGKTALNLFRL